MASCHNQVSTEAGQAQRGLSRPVGGPVILAAVVAAVSLDDHVGACPDRSSPGNPDQQAGNGEYNYRSIERPGEELPGLSVFSKDDDGVVYHTYSCYARGLDPLNSAYQLLDLTPKGRDEAGLEWPMAWLRRHDAYD